MAIRAGNSLPTRFSVESGLTAMFVVGGGRETNAGRHREAVPDQLPEADRFASDQRNVQRGSKREGTPTTGSGGQILFCACRCARVGGMVRPLRLEFPGALYHVNARGNARRAIVVDDEDRQGFLDVLRSD